MICGHFMNYVAKLKQLPKAQAWFPAFSVLIFLPHHVNDQFFHWISCCLRQGLTCYSSAVQTQHRLLQPATWDSNEGTGYIWRSSHVCKITYRNKHSWDEFWHVERSKNHVPITLLVKIQGVTPCYMQSYCLVWGEITHHGQPMHTRFRISNKLAGIWEKPLFRASKKTPY